MPRPERELDPQAGPLQRFAHDLRELRREAGEPGYRQLAAATRFSASALASAARGERLPSLQVTLAYVDACGGDRGDWKRSWERVRDQLAGAGGLPEDAPYLGLSRYETEDSGRYHGRGALVEEIVTRADRDGFVAVFGPSGSGKSSLVRAGVAPELPGKTAIVTPRDELPESGTVIVDQFEELFTLRTERTEYIDRLLAAESKVIIAVRADFYGHCAEHRGLTEALRDGSVLVGAMGGEDLREAIVKPASSAGLMVEPALVARVVQDAGTEPGALPLVSHALLETWNRRIGRSLTVAAYEAAGGVQGAIARTAEEIYEGLDEPGRAAMRRLLLRLVNPPDPGSPGGATRRPSSAPAGDVELVERLVNARLLTKREDTVEIAHEALVRGWPRLTDWIAEDVEGMRLHRRLQAAAADWEAMGRDPGSLYRGSRLAAAAEWAKGRDDLGDPERGFLGASVAAEQAERAAAARRSRTLKALVAALSVLLVAVLGAGAAAVSGRADADEQRSLARSRQLAAEAMSRLPVDVSGAADRARRAYGVAPTAEARSAVLTIASRQPYQRRLVGHAGMAKSVAIRPDGKELVTGGQDGMVYAWDPASGKRLGQVNAGGGAVRALAYSPDGTMLAGADLSGQVTIWETAGRKPVRRMRVGDVLDGLAFSPDGRLVAASGGAKKTVVWEAATGRKVHEIGGYGGKLTEIAFAPDGETLAIAGDDGRVVLWDMADRVRKLELSDGRCSPWRTARMAGSWPPPAMTPRSTWWRRRREIGWRRRAG